MVLAFREEVYATDWSSARDLSGENRVRSYGDEKLLPAYLRSYEVFARSFIIKKGRVVFERWANAPWGSEALQLLRDIQAES